MARPQWCALPQASRATMQRGCSAKKPRTFSRESFLRNPMPPSTRAPCAWKDRLARSRPIMLTFSMDASPFVGCENITTLAHRDAVRRGIHSIIRRLAAEYQNAADHLLELGRRRDPLSRAPYRLSAIHAI